jgi:hypothetical protein
MELKHSCHLCSGKALVLFSSTECITSGCPNFSEKLKKELGDGWSEVTPLTPHQLALAPTVRSPGVYFPGDIVQFVGGLMNGDLAMVADVDKSNSELDVEIPSTGKNPWRIVRGYKFSRFVHAPQGSLWPPFGAHVYKTGDSAVVSTPGYTFSGTTVTVIRESRLCVDTELFDGSFFSFLRSDLEPVFKTSSPIAPRATPVFRDGDVVEFTSGLMIGMIGVVVRSSQASMEIEFPKIGNVPWGIIPGVTPSEVKIARPSTIWPPVGSHEFKIGDVVTVANPIDTRYGKMVVIYNVGVTFIDAMDLSTGIRGPFLRSDLDITRHTLAVQPAAAPIAPPGNPSFQWPPPAQVPAVPSATATFSPGDFVFVPALSSVAIVLSYSAHNKTLHVEFEESGEWKATGVRENSVMCVLQPQWPPPGAPVYNVGDRALVKSSGSIVDVVSSDPVKIQANGVFLSNLSYYRHELEKVP